MALTYLLDKIYSDYSISLPEYSYLTYLKNIKHWLFHLYHFSIIFRLSMFVICFSMLIHSPTQSLKSLIIFFQIDLFKSSGDFYFILKNVISQNILHKKNIAM